ncbi:MAG: MerR family transcriptional regulator [Burkholderiaceae bacterium]|jgi:DNA-binding transcriptional MerR regulator|nr:MerR family transcriptional regulator [Burkholderiaceae bacterium]
MKIGEVASRTGLSAHTLRYYEKIGLIPVAPKDQAGQRAYDAAIFPWIEFLGRLKQTGMPIQGMLRYATLRAAGPVTELQRRDLLIAHRERVRAQIAQLQACVCVLDDKIVGYANTIMERTGHDTGSTL